MVLRECHHCREMEKRLSIERADSTHIFSLIPFTSHLYSFGKIITFDMFYVHTIRNEAKQTKWKSKWISYFCCVNISASENVRFHCLHASHWNCFHLFSHSYFHSSNAFFSLSLSFSSRWLSLSIHQFSFIRMMCFSGPKSVAHISFYRPIRACARNEQGN